MDYLNLGKIIKTHGLDGTLVIASNTYFGELRYQKGAHLILISPDNKEEINVTVEKYRNYKETDYVKFEEITDIDQAQLYKGYTVEIEKDKAQVPQGYYLFSDLIDCSITTTEGKSLGKVIEIEEFPAQITLKCKTNEGQEYFVPFIDDVFIKHVDINNKNITIKYMKGMLD